MSRCDCPPSLRSVGSAHERGRAVALAAPDGAGPAWAPGAERPQGRPAAAHFCAPDGADAPEDREKPLQLPPRPAFALGPDYLCASVSRTPFAEPRYIATPARAETLDQLAARWLPDPVLRAHAVARVDGREIPGRAWARVTPLAGSLVELAIRPAGRGKNPLATILQIALLAGALAISGGGLATLLGTTNLFAAGSISAGLAAAAFTVAGSYLINAIAPPPDLGLNRGGAEVSPTYFINAARNQLRLGAPVPALHGRHRMVPPLGGSYVREVRGDDLWLRGIVVWGIGPVEISDVRIGDTPFDQFAGTTIQHYPGDGTATPLSLYPNAPTELDVGATLSSAAGWIRRTTNANAEEISVDVDFPQGLARVNPKNGRLEARTVALEVRWAPADASGNPVGGWQTIAPTPAQADTAGFSLGGARVGDVPSYTFDQWASAVQSSGGGSGGSWSHTRSERKPFRRSRRWAVPRQPHGYVVEMRRVTPDTPDNDLEIVDTCVWSILRSVFMRAPVRDPWIAYSAFEIRASDQLNSVVDELNAVVERLYPDFDADGLKGSYGENGGLVGDWVKSRLPAHAVVDAMTGKGRQRPFGSDQMDFVFFDGWRQWCADNDRYFDHVVDYETTASRFIRTAMAAGQAGPLWRGAQLSGVIDAPRPVRRMLTARSMRRFSATLTFPGEIHGLSTEFLNEEQGWQLDDATVYVPGRGPENATRIERMPSPGKTRPEEVQTWLAFHLAGMLVQSRERYEIETDLPAFAVRRGERQLVSHDVVRAGTGARVIDVETDSAGDVTAVLLDEEIDIVAGTDYGMRWREPVPDPQSADPAQMVWSIRDTAAVTALAGRTARMVFVSPLPPETAPFEGDEVVVGERFAEAEDVVVLGVLRGDERASTLLAVPYGETRFSGDIVIPEFATSVQNPFKARPPRPRLAGAPYASDDGIAVPFTIETGATVPVARFIARWRRTPDGSETDGGFDALANVASDERRVILPAGDPAQPYDLDLWSEDYDGRRSEPLELRALVASEYVPTPDLLDVEAGHDETEGAKLPALTVRWDPFTNPEIANLRIAIRNPGQGVDDFEEIATADPDAGEKTTRDVPRGRTVEVGARFRSRRGGFSQWAVWPEPVAIPHEIVASDSANFGGLSLSELFDQIDADFEAGLADLNVAVAAVEADVAEQRRALGANIRGVLARLGGVRSGLLAEITERRTEMAVEVERIDALTARADDLEDGQALVEAAVIALDSAKADLAALEAVADSLDVVIARVSAVEDEFEPEGRVGEAEATIAQQSTAIANLGDDLSAAASLLSDLDAQINDGSTSLSAQVTEAQQAIASLGDDLGSLASVTLALAAEFEAGGRVPAAESAIIANQQAIADAARAEARALRRLRAQRLGNSARLTAESLVRTDETSALAQELLEVLAEIEGEAGVSPGLQALVAILAQAFVDTSDPDNPVARALFQVILDAGGGQPGIMSLRDSSGGSEMVLAFTRFLLAGYTSGDEIREIMRADANVTRFSTPVEIGPGMVLDPQYPAIIVTKGSSRKVISAGDFGADSTLVEWFGPAIPVDQMTKANAVRWEDSSGQAYFGGSISAGDIWVERRSLELAADASVEIGPTSTNGNNIQVVVSYVLNTSFNSASEPTPGGAGPSATITLQRSLGGGAWATVQTISADGSWSLIQAPDGTWTGQESMTGTMTWTDTEGGTTPRSFRALLSSRVTRWGVNINQSEQSLYLRSNE